MKINIRDFFAAAGRAEHAVATVGDVCNAVEHVIGIQADTGIASETSAASDPVPGDVGTDTAPSKPAAKKGGKKK